MLPDELTLIDRYFRPLSGEGAFSLSDDAALLAVPPDADLVVTTDMVANTIHFLPGDAPDTIAKKALRVNISDLAAKGARPIAYVMSLGISPETGEDWLAGFVQGLKEDQERFGAALLGGDTIFTHDGPVVSITAFGAVPRGRMVHRFGGNAGDVLFVSGAIGVGTAGLALLSGDAGPWDALPETRRAEFIKRYRVPEPRVELAAALAAFASAAMDISDGLVGDCDKLAAASGCSATIEAERVPLPEGIGSPDRQVLERLLTGGDDYEILAAVPAAKAADFEDAVRIAGTPVTRIGALTQATSPPEVLLGGRSLQLSNRSWVHGRGKENP